MIKKFKKRSIGGALAGLALMVALSGCALTNGKKANAANASKAPVDASVSGNVPTSSKTKHNQDGIGAKVGSKKQAPAHASDTKGHEKQLKDIIARAKNGKVKGANFVSGKTTIEDVHSTWGEPDRPWQPNDRYAYDSYSPGAGRGTYSFGIGRGEVVYDIRYYGSPMDESQAFNKISFTEIKRTLGTPSSVKTNGGDDILMYRLGNYELKFVGPHKTQRLDHISVYSPRAVAPMGGSSK